MTAFLCGLAIFVFGGICGIAILCIFSLSRHNEDRDNSERLQYLIDCRLTLKPAGYDYWIVEDEDGCGSSGENPYELIDQCIAGHGP